MSYTPTVGPVFTNTKQARTASAIPRYHWVRDPVDTRDHLYNLVS